MEALPGLITAFVALLTAIGAIWQNRAGRRDAERQTRAARALEQREQLFNESEAALEAHKALGETYRAEIARLSAARDADHVRYEKEREADAEKHAKQLAKRDEAFRRQLAECTHARKDLHQMVSVLSNAIRTEVHHQTVEVTLATSDMHGRSTDPEH